MKQYLAKPRIVYADVIVCVILIFLYFAYNIMGLRSSDLSMKNSQISMGFMVYPLSGEEESMVVIDSGKSEVLGIRKGKVDFRLTVNKDHFYQAENFCLDPADSSFYLHSVDWSSNGFSLASERILHYDSKGRFLGTAYEKTYTLEEEVNQHRLYDPRVIGGELYVLYADEHGITQLRIQDGVATTVITHAYEDAWIFFQNFSQAGEKDFYGVEKRGHLMHFLGEKMETAYTFQKEEKEVLYFVECDPQGELYYTDIYNGRVCQVTGENQSKVIVSLEDFYTSQELEPGQDQMVSLKFHQVGEDKLLGFALQAKAVICDAQGKIRVSSEVFPKDFSFLLKAGVVLGIYILAGLLFFYLCLRVLFYFWVNRPKTSALVKIEFGFAVFAALLTVMILFRCYNSFEDIYIFSEANHLEDLARTGTSLLQEEWIHGVHDMSDFMGEDYKQISESLRVMAAESQDINRRYGGAVVILDEDGRCYFLAYPDNSISVYYPTDAITKEGIVNVYQNKAVQKNLSLLSSGGTFIATSVPILGEEDQVIGVLTMTLDNYMEQSKINNVIRNIFINVLLVVILIMFLLNEGFGFAEGYRVYRLQDASRGPMPFHMLRIAAFGISFVLNMTSSFLSVYTSSFWRESLGIARELAGAFPLFANGAFLAVSALFCPVLLKKWGFQRVTALGVVMAMVGDCLAGLSRSYFSICLALFLNGWGFGILINSLSITIGSMLDPRERENGYAQFNAGSIAGVNCGMIFGSILAMHIRHNEVFFVTTVLWALQFVIFYLVSRALPKEKMGAGEEAGEKGSSPEKKRIVSFQAIFYVVCVTFPYALGGSFMYFYLPILVTSLGYTEGYISLLMMIYAVCGIILGKSLTSILWGRLREKSMLAAIIMSVVGWMTLVSYRNLNMMSMAMLLIGISYSFGLNVCISTYLEGKGVARMNPEDAMGLYEFSSRVGQCISPIICGLMMGLGITWGMGAFAILSVSLFIVYLLLFCRKGDRGRRHGVKARADVAGK